ncbi:hypothetical protein Hanom_Chr17g01549361 [Helianthus anomalus]
MHGVNEPGENSKISNLLNQDAENKPLDESRKTGQTSGTKMAFYLLTNYNIMILTARGKS